MASQLEQPKEQGTPCPPPEAKQENDFTYQGYQVVRGELITQLQEPALTFSQGQLAVNHACLCKLPQVRYVQLLVNPHEKRLAVQPCSEEVRDSLPWCTVSRKPKRLSCQWFFAKVVELTGWNPDYRYRLRGKLVQAQGGELFLFDLTAPEIFSRGSAGNPLCRKPIYPAGWQQQFGLPVEEHRKAIQSIFFHEYVVFDLAETSQLSPEDTR